MAVIKEHTEEVKRTFWQKTLKILKGVGVVFLLVFLLGGFIALSSGPTEKVPEQKMQYQVRVSNSIGSEYYDCDNYTRTDNTYVLYDSLGVKTNEITITDGYAVRISLNNE